MTDYKATPEIWAWIESFADDSRDIATAILELRARVEALEANAKPTSNLNQIRSSLVKRVQQAINAEYEESLGTGCMEARAAIREVAAWLKEEGFGGPWARLEQEAER